jgi:hypothetical protein
VATQAIRRGANRKVLDRIAETATIYDAWADEPWVLEGAAVRVSLICFGIDIDTGPRLDGQAVPKIHSDISGEATDLTRAKQLRENLGVCFQGPVKVGAFDIPGSQAREWLQRPLNPNGRSNADVVRPLVNGRDLTARRSNSWIIDFEEMNEAADRRRSNRARRRLTRPRNPGKRAVAMDVCTSERIAKTLGASFSAIANWQTARASAASIHLISVVCFMAPNSLGIGSNLGYKTV